MKPELKFYDSESNALSNCGDVLDIEFSNHGLDWSGVLIEKDLNWSVEKDGTFADLKTSPGNI